MATISLLLSLLLFVAAYFTYTQVEPHMTGGIYYPFRVHTPYLLIAGVTLLVLGIASLWRATMLKEK